MTAERDMRTYGCTHDWRDQIKRGDVLESANGTQRVVRRTSYRKNGLLYGVVFTIRRCSWTGRCYTVMTRSDLGTFGFRPTGTKYSLRTKLDKAIDRAIGASHKPLDCCDVKGIA